LAAKSFKKKEPKENKSEQAFLKGKKKKKKVGWKSELQKYEKKSAVGMNE